MVRKEKGPFTKVEEHFPPIFVVQVLDSDAQTPDDFLGKEPLGSVTVLQTLLHLLFAK